MVPQQINSKLISWASVLEDKTRIQAETASMMPFIYPHIALMPDAHLGKGATVGSVIPTLDAIMPAAVGVDIGCGMMAVRTQFTGADVRARGTLRPLRLAIEKAIPLSAGKYNTRRWDSAVPRIAELEALAGRAQFDPAADAANWRLQLGSLGSGNHFIEVTLDELDRVWLFLHSGSRGIGNKIATRHIRVAQQFCARQRIQLPHRDLAYLVDGTPEFRAYIRELEWAQHFALLNRDEMMDRLVACLAQFMGQHVERQETIRCHHNYTAREHHFGRDVWLSRKGAINAYAGVPGLIPGSMGTASYIVIGKGNRLALCSSPHGAGRYYSRNMARRTFTRADLEAAMKGIEWRHTDAFLDEIPAAYKDIDVVMADAKDLVEVKHRLRQILNVKGD
jgi:tRNA-splicing ligase RtcB